MVIAVLMPISAAQTMHAERRLQHDQPEEGREHQRAEQQERPGAPLQAVGHHHQQHQRQELRAVEPAPAPAPSRSAWPRLAR